MMPDKGRMRQVAVFVQTCPQRSSGVEETLKSVRESDIRDGFEVHTHPRGVPKCQFFAELLEKMAACDAQYVIRLEDDVLVNRHLVHNFLTWPALRDPLFGAGWLYVSQAALSDTMHTASSGLEHYRNSEVMYGSLCVAAPREVATAALKLVREWAATFGCALDTCDCPRKNKRPRSSKTYGQDAALSRAVWKLGKRVFFHRPVLAENRMLPSTHGLKMQGNPAHWRAGRLFDANWRRR